MNILKKNEVTFLSETWSTAPSSPCQGKTFFSVPATKSTGRGRPSGGLELLVSPSLSSRLLSSSDHHLCVHIPNLNLTVVGVYYKPSLDMDEVVEDLTRAIDASPDGAEIVVGGDFNRKLGDSDFGELCEFLGNSSISLLSDPETTTFIGAGGSSCVDHIFGSRSMTEF